ncbi:1,5-anhydro-D-fructose reductase-like [Contarinia nasturtii]|uniref:1,5-anhydro-D-fructose reductase-like n=1 Tax=Contarinia nasturtii TaxID=265458 RepID=UPI0012D3C1DB|nr:1,5-anhydro-D-fructose reductase-like [Contarinia nasturtii]
MKTTMFHQQVHHSHWPMIAILVVLFNFTLSADEKPIFAPRIRLNDGNSIPVLGLGTSRAKQFECEQAVKDAIDIGYRHIDTAYVYENEKEVGNAIRAKISEGVIKREDIFVTTKLSSTFHEPDSVAKAFEKSLDNLNITYIDLYLMHTPMAFARISKVTNMTTQDFDNIFPFPHDSNGKYLTVDIDYLDTWKAMEELMKTGKVRSLGVSNFNSQQLDRVISVAKIKPVVNQIECHPNLNQKKLIEFARSRNVTIVGYSPLGRPSDSGDRQIALKNAKVQEMATEYKKNPGQILLRYSYQNGVVSIPKSTNKERLRGNIDIFDFSLNDKDMEFLDSLNDNTRVISFADGKDSKYYPFNIEF